MHQKKIDDAGSIYIYIYMSLNVCPVRPYFLISMHIKGVFGMSKENVMERKLIKKGKGNGKGYTYLLFGIKIVRETLVIII